MYISPRTDVIPEISFAYLEGVVDPGLGMLACSITTGDDQALFKIDIASDSLT